MRSRTPHRAGLLAAALAATLLAAACGSPASDEAKAKAPARIRIAGTGGSALAGGAGPAASSEAADSKIAGGLVPGFGPIEYVVEGTLPALDGDAAAWHYPAANGVKADEVAKLAERLGLAGDVREVPAEEGGGWRVGSTDYTAPWLMVERTGMGTWYYDAAAYGRADVACAAATGEGSQPADPGAKPAETSTDTPTNTSSEPAVSTAPDGGAASSPASDCPAPTPPANVPSADEARAKALALADELGAVPDAADVRVEGDQWGRYVTWSFRLGGVVSPVSWSATYGGDGVLMSASGALATPEQAADYPRVGTAAALDLLRTGQAWGGPTPAVMPAVMPAVIDDTTGGGGSASSGAVATGSSGSGEASPGAPDVPIAAPSPPMTRGDDAEVTLPVAPVEPVTMTITGAEATLYLLYGVDGEVWLVPGYRFSGPTGDVAVVPAIDDSYVEQVAPADDTVVGQARAGVDAPPVATETAPAKP